MKVFWSWDAKNDRERIALYVAQFDRDAALKLLDIFEEGGRILERFPYMGLAGRVDGTRELRVHRPFFWSMKS